MRILADLPEQDIKWLDDRAAQLGKSRAALLREAVTAFREGERDWLEQGFGLWTRYGMGVDGSNFESAVRAQWTRNDTATALQPHYNEPEPEPEPVAEPEAEWAEPEPDEPVEEDAPRRGWFR